MRKKQEAKHANKKIWKRRLLAGLIACGIFVTTGCGQVIDLTDEENHLIAEYAAELLLKYDRNYDTRYNPDELEDTTETMTETDATTEATTEVVSTTEAATTEQDAPADGQTTQAQPVTDEAVKEDIGATVVRILISLHLSGRAASLSGMHITWWWTVIHRMIRMVCISRCRHRKGINC